MAGAGADRTRLCAPHFRLAAHATGPGSAAEAHGGASLGGETSSEFVELEDWDFEETIRHAQQLVRSVTSDSAVGAAREPVASRAAATSSSPVKPGGTLPWLILALGIGIFACGAALMGLSLAQGSTPLWQLALPMVLGGQLAVLLVVIWQLDVVWHSNRATFVALHAMDEQLRQLRLDAGHSGVSEPAAKRLVQHLAEDTSPHILLNDLRAQLDALAMRLGNSKDAA